MGRRAHPRLRRGPPGAAALWFVHALGDSSEAWQELFASSLSSRFQLLAPDWCAEGKMPRAGQGEDLEALADWLVGTIESNTAQVPIGLVGHSLGAAIAVKAAKRRGGVVGVFSIEGNLTAADAYFSGLAASFTLPAAYRKHLLERIRALEQAAPEVQREPLRRYQASLRVAAPEPLWSIGRSARRASQADALGEDYRTLPMPTLYYYSRLSTPPESQDYIRRSRLASVEFVGGHWPMIQEPELTAAAIDRFFRPLFSGQG